METITNKVRTPLFGSTLEEELENLTLLFFVAVATAVWFGWKLLTRERSWIQVRLSHYLSLIFGIDMKGGELRLTQGTPTPAIKKAKKKVQFQQPQRPVVNADVDASLSVDTLSLLLSRFPRVSKFCAQTEECHEFLDELKAKMEQPLVQAGLAGVQTWLSCNVKWGPFGSDRGAWCDIADKLKKLRCTAASSFAKWAMGLSEEVQKKEVFVGQCQFVLKCNDPSEVTMIQNFFAEDGKTPDYFLVGNMMYHECIVKVTDIEKRATVWDYGIEYDAPNSSKAGLSIVAFRFVGDFPSDIVHFGNYNVPTNKWFTTCPELRHPQVVSILKPYLSQHQNKKHIDLYGLRMQNKAENHQFTVFISGTAMNNGNPCPGVGLARCLRRSYGNRVKIVGFEYSLASGGIRDPVFDESLIIKQFYGKKPFVKKEVLGRVKRALTDTPNSFYISAFDVEIDLLTQAKNDFEGEKWVEQILIPTNAVLESTEKPEIDVIQKFFGMTAPEYVWVEEENDDELKAFFIAHGPCVLAKGVKFGCSAVGTPAQAKNARSCFDKKWGTKMFLQKSIHGYERSYMFASHNGKLLGAIEMRKDIVTAEGKCWGVHLEPLTVETMENLKRMCAETKWTGGGEIEFMEDMSGRKYCTDFNPRFPAWVFGGCHGGINLPGLLLQEATGIATDDVTSPTLGGDFIRSVLEVPVCNKMVQPVFMAGPDLSGCRGAVVTKASFGSLNLSDNEVVHAISHPSRFGEIAQLSRVEEGEEETDVEDEEDKVTATVSFPEEDIWVFEPSALDKTPQFIFDVDTLKATIDSITEFTEKININTIVGLSVKTQPHDVVLQTAKDAGWYGECISQAEVQKCLDMGWPSSEIIVNGPLKNWPAPLPKDGLKAWFADSLADWDELIETTPAEYIGFRLTPHNITSRFGVPIEKWREMKKRFDAVPETQRVGLHFHFAQTKIGSKSWFAMARSVIRMIPMMTKRATLLDFGGGWIPGELAKHVEQMNELIEFAKKRCPLVETVVFEPGKSVTQSSGGFVTEVKAFRGGCGQQRNHMKKTGEFHGEGIIVDGFIGDLGVYGLHRHPCFYNSCIEIKNENVAVRCATQADLPFLVDSVLTSTNWDCQQNAEKVLCGEFFHFSKWLVAELEGEVIGCVFSYDMDAVQLDFEATNPLADMVVESILSERNGLHLLCLRVTNEEAYGPLFDMLVKSETALKQNSIYLLQNLDSEESLDEFGFVDQEKDDEEEEEEEKREASFKVLERKHWTLLQPGKDKILGRICMEFDQFGHVKTPANLKVGDRILIRECGAYDMTMSYLFGDAKQRDIVCV